MASMPDMSDMPTNRLQLKGQFGAKAERREMTMVSILSGKGGVGKSVIAFNLAERLAAKGHRTLLVDADVTSGNLHLLANVDGGDNVRRLTAGEPLRVLTTEVKIASHTSLDPALFECRHSAGGVRGCSRRRRSRKTIAHRGGPLRIRDCRPCVGGEQSRHDPGQCQ